MQRFCPGVVVCLGFCLGLLLASMPSIAGELTTIVEAVDKGKSFTAAKPKTTKDRTALSAAAQHRKPRSADILDSGQARDAVESALENYRTMLAVTGNNIANAETPGYKRSQVIVEDLGYQQKSPAGVQDSSGQYSPNGFSIGSGSQIVGTEIDFRQGSLMPTGRGLDVAIKGAGFFQVRDPSGNIYYSRAGHFSQNANGQLVVASAKSGRLLEPAITIPNDATCISIGPQGVVAYLAPSSTKLTQAGTIQLANFTNVQGLTKIGENLYQESDGSGACQTASPGSNGCGTLQQGWIEKSNVDLPEEIATWKRIRRTCRELRSLLECP